MKPGDFEDIAGQSEGFGAIVKEVISYINEHDDFFIATHINPEGDALGSAIALSIAIERLGKKCTVFDRDKTPEFYKFMPGAERITNAVPATERLSLILVDCNTPERAAIEGRTFKRTAVIDHHETETDFGDVKWIEPDAPATGLMMYKLLKEMKTEITKDIAINLYTAIAVDTGVFRFYNTTAETLRIAAELADAGADPGAVADEVYQTWSEARFRLLCMTMGSIEIADGVAFMTVTKAMFEASGATVDDTETFAHYPRMMKDIKVSAFLREVEDGWKVSLRSKRDINVAPIAERFGGGGHRNAAGCTIKADIKTVKQKLLDAVRTGI
jgi:phosphoesterase RecJ-like protein